MRMCFWALFQVHFLQLGDGLPPQGLSLITGHGCFLDYVFWQVPHVMAIAWIYQKDYAHAGFQMLPKSDSQGLKASFWVVFSLLALFPNIVKLWVLDLGSWVFLIGGITLAIGYLLSGLNFAWKRDESSARALMIFSFIYLPGTWLVLGLDRFILYLQTVFG